MHFACFDLSQLRFGCKGCVFLLCTKVQQRLYLIIIECGASITLNTVLSGMGMELETHQETG